MSPYPDPVFVAKRRFDPGVGEHWARYVAWSGLTQLTELVSLDEILCPTVPATLIAADWEHNVHADYQTSYFRSLEYLCRRVAGEPKLNILGLLQNPSAGDVEGVVLPGFEFGLSFRLSPTRSATSGRFGDTPDSRGDMTMTTLPVSLALPRAR